MMRVVLFLQLISTAFGSHAHNTYVRAMRSKLGIFRDGANVTTSREGTFASHRMDPGKLILVIPPSYVRTVQEAIGVGGWINQCALKLPRTLPRHFVLAVSVLYEMHLGNSNDLWRLWLESLPPLDNATIFWTEEQVEELEEERAIKRTRARRAQLKEEYRTMMRVLYDECMQDDLPGSMQIDEEQYLWAVTVVTRYAWHFASDFPVLVPLSLRFHPRAASDIAEWGNETDPGASMYVGSDSALRPGDELTAWSETADNIELLLHAGYVWDELASASVRIQLNRGGLSSVASRDAGPHDAKRRQLLAGANWSTQMDFELTYDRLNPEMFTWLRLAFAEPAELASAASHEAFSVPASVNTEGRAFNALFVTLENTLAKYDHAVEEDDEILSAIARKARSRGVRSQSASRKEIAVTYRRQCKRVLMRTQELARTMYNNGRRRQVAGTGASKRRRHTATTAIGVDADGAVTRLPSS